MFTQVNVADDIAASAHLLMAERDERIGCVVIRNAPITEGPYDPTHAKLNVRRCLFCSAIGKSR